MFRYDLSKVDRRKFITAAVGGAIVAAAGVSYFTRDLWYSVFEKNYKTLYKRLFPEPTSTPIENITITRTNWAGAPTSYTTQSITTTTTMEKTSPTAEITEEEQQVREFLLEFRDLYASHDARISDLYTDDAWHSWYTFNSGNEIRKGKSKIHSFYYWNFLGGKMDIQSHTFQITNIEISTDKKQISVRIGGQDRIVSLTATANCHYNWGFGGAWCCRGTSDFLLVYIPRSSPHIAGNDDVWKIKNEKTKIIRIG